MHNSLENDEKEGEFFRGCFQEIVFRENSLNKVIAKERSGCKRERNMCAEEKKNKEYRIYEN